jgi:hypothetical protein
MKVHLIRFTFDQFPPGQPLFNYEALYKTIKGYFHEIKRLCLPAEVYESTGPLFHDPRLGAWSFLGELRPLLLFGTTLAVGAIIGQPLEDEDGIFAFLNEHFPGGSVREDFQRFSQVAIRSEVRQAVGKLLEQGLVKVELSAEPFDGDARLTMLDVMALIRQKVDKPDSGEDEEESEPTKEAILENLKESMRLALAGQTRPARQVLDTLWKELDADDS